MTDTLAAAGDARPRMPMGVTCAVHTHRSYVPMEKHHVWPLDRCRLPDARERWGMTEEWRPVVGWEGLYEVSDHSRHYQAARKGAARHGAGKAPVPPWPRTVTP